MTNRPTAMPRPLCQMCLGKNPKVRSVDGGAELICDPCWKKMSRKAMRPIPISAGKRIADEYGYDQVIIIARKVGEAPDPHGEHVTTYGVNTVHCAVAAKIGDFFKHKLMGWPVP